MFIGREQELEFLNKRYKSNQAEFIVVYGRRRVGKTELLTEFCRDKPSFFYICNEYTGSKQFASFSDALFAFAPSLHKSIRRFSDWEDAFSALGELPGDKKTVVVIDEFPYMCRGDKSIPSVIQNLWDSKLRNANIMFIISGSSISFIEDELLGVKNPLYGRATGIYKLEPMPFEDAVKFFPDYSDEDKILAFSVLGGVPHYLKQFDPDNTLENNIKEKILTKGTVLFNEVEYILHQELREPVAYITLLEAIAYGNCKFGEICSNAHMESSKVSVYLKNLLELGFVMREFPVLTTAKDKTKKNIGEYRLSDNFFRFWFAYAYRYMSELEQGEAEIIWRQVIEKDLHRFASKTFEEVAIRYLRLQNRFGLLPFTFLSVGRWWGNVKHRDEKGKPYSLPEEIDILACSEHEKRFIIGECKFRNEAFDMRELEKLRAKHERKGEIYYYLFSLGGFTDKVKEEANIQNNIALITPSDMLK
ncbi:MAG: ATP-binding protein [Clostridiales bacterium]|nr:ATP-binding protein [Clostridiales bacterium]